MKIGLFCILLLCVAQYSYAAPAVFPEDNNALSEQDLAQLRGIFSFGKDFYNDLIAAPINHLAGSLASMLAQFTLGVIDNGIIVGKRSITIDDFPKGFFEDFSASFVNSIYPTADKWVQTGALALTQWLANIANGGKSKSIYLDWTVNDAAAIQALFDQLNAQFGHIFNSGNSRGLFDWMTNFGTTLGNEIYPHVDSLVQTGALALTQWLANFANGGKQRGVFDWFSNFGATLGNEIYPHVDSLVQTGALALTQWLANFANGGKQRGVFDWFSNFGSTLGNEIYPHVDSLVQTGALALTQWLANFANGGNRGHQFIEPMSHEAMIELQSTMQLLLNEWFNVVNKDNARGITDWFLNFGSTLGNQIYPHVDSLVQTGALALTQWLANFANGGKGRMLIIPTISQEDIDLWIAQLQMLNGNSRGIFDWISNFGSNLGNEIYPHVDSLVQTSALALTQWLANFANGGKQRGVFDWISNFGSTLGNEIYPHVDSLVQTGALALTQWLANFANGGKQRGVFDWFSNFGSTLGNEIYPHVDSLVQTGALALTQWLANFANGGKGRSMSLATNLAQFENNRGLSDYYNDLKDKLTATINSIAQSLAVPITNGLVHIMNNGLLPTIGKRDLSA